MGQVLANRKIPQDQAGPHQNQRVPTVGSLIVYCLMKIYSLLPILNLCELKSFHGRLAETADTVFKKKYLDVAEFYEIPGKDRDYENCAQMSKHFGDDVREVVMYFSRCETKEEARRYFSLLNHFSALEVLTVFDCSFDDVAVNLVGIESFKNLTTLSLINCSGSSELHGFFRH